MQEKSNEVVELQVETSQNMEVNATVQQQNGFKKQRNISKMDKKKLVFCIVMSVLPLLQFVLFYICVNINTILLAFQRVNVDGALEWGFFNFKTLFQQFGTDVIFRYALKNSLIAFFFSTIVQVPLTLLFSYYIFKKSTMGGFFKITLFLPSVVTSIVLVMVYTYFVDDALPIGLTALLGVKIRPFYSNYGTRFIAILLYSVVMSFGSNVLMFLSSMKSINESMLEAARLDGATYFQEYIYVIFPMCYPTMVTFIIIGISGIFTNQLNLVSFMGTENPLPLVQTFGYYLFQQTAELGSAAYPRLSALGLLISLVVVPLTFLVKWLLEKLGPSTEA